MRDRSLAPANDGDGSGFGWIPLDQSLALKRVQMVLDRRGRAQANSTPDFADCRRIGVGFQVLLEKLQYFLLARAHQFRHQTPLVNVTKTKFIVGTVTHP